MLDRLDERVNPCSSDSRERRWQRRTAGYRLGSSNARSRRFGGADPHHSPLSSGPLGR